MELVRPILIFMLFISMRPQLILIIDAIHIYEATIGVDAIYMVPLQVQTSQRELVTWEWWDLWTHEGGFPYIQHVSFCSFSTLSLFFFSLFSIH